MKAVNLIPSDNRKGVAGAPSRLSFSPTYVLLGMLGVAVVFVTLYVLTGNTISSRQSQVATLQTELAQTQAQVSRLDSYSQFDQLASARAQTVREIASTRFGWYSALSDLSKVVPTNTSLQSLFGSVAPGASVSSGGGGAGGAASSLRGDLSVPAFELTGCTRTQDDVARLMSRLRLIDGVARVTLGDSQKQAGTQPGATVGSSTTSTGGGCGPNTPTFDLVVFFQPLAGAGPNGAATVSAQPSGTATTTTGGSK
jgi:Tfp pilus assembly protein PilN